MTMEKRTAALEARVEEISERLVAMERRMDYQTTTEELSLGRMQDVKKGVEALEKQMPVNSASREVMWRRIEALEGAPTEHLPPMMGDLLRRLAALEERMRGLR